MKKIIFTLLIFHYTLLISNAQWYSVDNGSSGDLREIKFKNENTGWYVSDNLQIYKTINGGINWKCLDIQNIDSLNSFSGLICYGDTLLISLGQTRILRSNNGGDNWFAVNTNLNRRIVGIQFVKKELIFALACTSDYSYADLIKSTNLGLTWNHVYSFGSSEIDLGPHVYNFVNDSIGFCKGYRTISKTTNGGYHWDTVFVSTVQMDFLYFVNSDLGFLEMALMDGFFKTTNGGITWVMGGHFYPYDILFENMNTGYMLAPDTTNTLFKTTDGGSTWDYLFKGPPFHLTVRTFVDLEKINSTFYIAARSGGGLFKSTNGGANFQDISKYETENSLNSIDFINETTGFTGGSKSGILQTTNGGTNWFDNQSFKSITSYYNRFISKIQFLNQNTGWLLSDTGFFKTINSGNNWFYYPTTIYNPQRFCYINSNTGWVTKDTSFSDSNFMASNFTALYQTTNNGVNFAFKGFLRTSGSSDIIFFDSLYGYVCCEDFFKDTCLFRTTNSGKTWQGIPLGRVSSIDIINRDIAFLTQGRRIFKTTNGGNNWVKVDSSYYWRKIKFINDKAGFVIADDKNIFYTTNSGINWIYSNIGSNNSIFDIYFNNQGLGIIVGNYGKIYKTTNYGGIVFINNQNEIIPGKYNLEQNYPNPFNPSTTIKYVLPKNEFVTIKIYDILGKEIITLLNEYKYAGNYSVIFNGNNFASGIYFYRLKAKGFSETKRMTLIK